MCDRDENENHLKITVLGGNVENSHRTAISECVWLSLVFFFLFSLLQCIYEVIFWFCFLVFQIRCSFSVIDNVYGLQKLIVLYVGIPNIPIALKWKHYEDISSRHAISDLTCYQVCKVNPKKFESTTKLIEKYFESGKYTSDIPTKYIWFSVPKYLSDIKTWQI